MIERDLAKIPALKSPAYAEVQITCPFDMAIYKNVPGYRPFMSMLRVPGKGDCHSFVVTGPPAADGCFDYPADRKYVIERDSGEKPSKAQFETLLPRLQDYFRAREPEIKQRRDVSIGEQFVIPKETRAIKPDAIGNEIEPELRRAELATLFRIDGDKLVPAGRMRKEIAPSGPFAALEQTGILRRFVSSIDTYGNFGSLGPQLVRSERLQAELAYSIEPKISHAELVEKAEAFLKKHGRRRLLRRLGPDAQQRVTTAATKARQAKANERIAQHIGELFNALSGLLPDLPELEC
jgi:hypothetical protein